MLEKYIRYFLDNKLVTVIFILFILGFGLVNSPFDWKIGFLPSSPVAVDAIPNIGENQQIVFTEWKGRSPQDIEDQISYPLTTSLLGISGVKSIRSNSIFGVSYIYIIFNDDVDFYWSRSRILEKLNSLPKDLLPNAVQPVLGPDATALGQVYWYTLEGRNSDGEPTGGWDLAEIREVQDFYVKYGLNGVEGVSEVASIGGYVQEYQINVNPNALRSYGITLQKVLHAVKKSNRDVGAKTLEINQVEYLIRGLGSIKSIEDIEQAVVAINEHVPITISDVAIVKLGPSTRRGLLDKGGAEAVGGVVVARYGTNPMKVIDGVKEKIEQLASGLPKKTLSDGTVSQLTVVPFYDRTKLINETLGTLEEALSLEMLITIIVVILMLMNLRASLLVSSLLPLSVLIVFIAMKYFKVEANIVALSGIAIAIGTMVDLGIILSENILKHIEEKDKNTPLKEKIYNAVKEVGSAIVTAVATTIVSFIPVFTMEAAEGKLFMPLAYTKTFALLAALIVALFILPTIAQWIFGFRLKRKAFSLPFKAKISAPKLSGSLFVSLKEVFRYGTQYLLRFKSSVIVVIGAIYLLANYWMPLGAGKSLLLNILFVGLILGLILGVFMLLEKSYGRILYWCLENKRSFLVVPMVFMILASCSWLGFDRSFGFLAKGADAVGWNIRKTNVWSGLSHQFPGIGKEFMPSLDEGSFLLMPTSMPHSGIKENKRIVQQLDMLLENIPEVELAVGKMGRINSALDPAPISMFENIIHYKSEFVVNEKGHRIRFKTNNEGLFIMKNGEEIGNEQAIINGLHFDELIENTTGSYFRNWRSNIKSSDDIWNEIVKVTQIPGVTSAPRLQPIETRLVMLQTGMRAPMGIKVFGPDLTTIENFGKELESILKKVPKVKSNAVFAERIVGKPYIHLNINRTAIARYGLYVEDVQQTIETAIGGMQLGTTVEGRERFSLSVRYPREMRDDPESLKRVYLDTPSGEQIQLGEVVDVEYLQGPQMIKSENTFLLGYVLLDKIDGVSEVEAVEQAEQYIQQHIDEGTLVVPEGLSYKFSGTYENQIRAEKSLAVIIPIVLLMIMMILYFQFKSIGTALMIFVGVGMAFSGGFILLWLYGQGWFMNVSLFDINMRDLFQIDKMNLSVAVWVGFIALFGIATDDGVLIGTYLDQSFAKNKPTSVEEIRKAVCEAGSRRIKPAIMTTVTTLIALLPVLTSTGRGADIMIPMAIPAFGGMLVAIITYFITPVLYGIRAEYQLKKSK